jgi:ACS family tartrate transporter-like MFS transporter
MSVALMATLTSKIDAFRNMRRALSSGYANPPVRKSGAGMMINSKSDAVTPPAVTSSASTSAATAIHNAIARKIRRRLLPLLFILYIAAYLDRINVGFAALVMNHELGLSSEQYGLLSGMFFWGYFLFEVPSNLILERIGARVWIARILMSWGVVALATGFAHSAMQLYLARFLLGAAEAGFFPGILLYLTYWFRQQDVAQTIGLFMTALPTASIVGGPLSGWILDHVHAFGLSSWRWVLILEALPAIVGGMLTYLILPNAPAEATFLTPEDKASLTAALRAESDVKERPASHVVLHTIGDGRVLYLAAVAFMFMMGLYVTGFWMPQSIKSVGPAFEHTSIGLLVMVPNLVGLCAMLLVSKSSSRRGDTHWHAALSLMAAAIAFCFVGTATTAPNCILLWSLATSGLYGFIGPFWSMPGRFLTGRAAAVALASICSVGNLAGFGGLAAIGSMAGRPGGLAQGFRFVAVSLSLVSCPVNCRHMYCCPSSYHRNGRDRDGDGSTESGAGVERS